MNILLRKLISLTLILLFTGVAFSQKKKKIDQADKLFKTYRFIDARKIYEEILKKNPDYGTADIYQKLGDTYYLNGQYKEAVDKYTTLKDKFPEKMAPIYYFKLAQSLKSQGNDEEAKEVLKGLDSATLASLYRPVKDDINLTNYILDPVSINTINSSDFGTSYYQDKLVYASASKISEGDKTDDWTGEPYLDLYLAEIDEDGKLKNPESIRGEINTKYHESSAAFTRDGTTIYFTRNNFIGGKAASDKNKTIRLKLYKATKSGDNYWTNVRELTMTDRKDSTINSNDWSTAHPALSVDEKRLYFASDRPGSKPTPPQSKKEDTIVQSDIWYVDILPGTDKYGIPKPVEGINTIARETFPFISEKNELYFSSDGDGSEGGLDVFKTELDETGKPGKILRFGEPINSNQDDFGFIWSDTRKIGYFTSNRPDAKGGSAADDIYRVIEQCEITLTGIVSDIESGELLPGAEVFLFDGSMKPITSMIVGADARYNFSGKGVTACDTEYLIRGTKKDYDPYEKFIRTPKISDVVDTPLLLDPPCSPGDIGCILCIKAIYFDFDGFDIRKDIETDRELNKVLITLEQYPDLKIRIESHTDSRGSFQYNVNLAQKRAESTLNRLIQLGADRNRLVAEGFGERQLLDRCTILDECGKELQIEGCSLDQFTEKTSKCSDGVKCTEDEHQQNRRSKFIAIEE